MSDAFYDELDRKEQQRRIDRLAFERDAAIRERDALQERVKILRNAVKNANDISPCPLYEAALGNEK